MQNCNNAHPVYSPESACRMEVVLPLRTESEACRQHASVHAGIVRQMELVEDSANVNFHRSLRQEQFLADRLVRQAVGKLFEHALFRGAERSFGDAFGIKSAASCIFANRSNGMSSLNACTTQSR